MTRKRGLFILVLLAGVTLSGFSQNSRLIYYMKLPQNHFLNPALKPATKFYLGLPIVTNFNFGINNNFLELTDLLTPDVKSDDIISFQNPDFSLEKFASKLKANNNITPDLSIQLFGLGFVINDDLNIFVDVTDKVGGDLRIPGGFMDLYTRGFSQYLNQTISISGLNINAQYYREYGFGFSKNIMEKLRIGARAKILVGIASMSLDNRVMTMKINNDLTQSVTADASLDISGKDRLNGLRDDLDGAHIRKFLSDYLRMPSSNIGLGMDVGAVFNLNRMFSFSVSLVDLGYIKWKDQLKSYTAKNSFLMPAFSLKDVVDNNISLGDMVSGIQDTIKKSFIENNNPKAFKTYIPTSLILGANVNLLNIISFGVLSESKIFSGQLREAVTLSANLYVLNAISATVSYTAANYTYNNFGIGLAFKTGPTQFFVVADKIPSNWSTVYLKKGDNNYQKLRLPDQWNTLKLQMGMNIAFGRTDTRGGGKGAAGRKNDRPMVLID